MDETAPGPATPDAPERAGEMLRATRERQGLSLAEVAARTRVPLRHLEAIEASNYSGLPSLTYATGFAKAYARAVGADEVEIARAVRAELAGVTRPQRPYQPYAATDPARVPSKGVAMIAAGLALAVALLAGLYFATGLFRGGAGAPSPEVVAVTPGTAIAVAPAPVPVAAEQVLVTATDEVWVRIYDAAGTTIHQGILQAGQRFDVPADANDPMINVGRPDKIAVTLNGSQVQGLNLGDQPIRDVRVSAAALRTRAAGEPVAPEAGDATPGSVTGSALDAGTERTARAERPARPAPSLTETQRANLESARVAARASGNVQ